MFTPGTLMLAMVVLVGFAIAALLYALLYNRIDAGARREKRLAGVAGAAPGAAKVAAQSRKVDGATRRKNVQDTLKELELKQKHKASRSTNPPLRLRLQQAGLTMTVGRFYVISAMAGVAALGLAFALKAPPLLAAGFALTGALGLPRFVVNFLRKRRQKAFTEELPNAVEVIVRGVKAGLPLNDCLRMIASEAREPVRSEFRAAVEAQQLGIPMEEAIARIYERMPLPEANFFATVIAIQAKAGGNLSEALGNLAKVLRERKKMRAKILSMSSEAKSGAAIIGSMPVVVGVLVYITSPDYISVLWTDPRGQIVLGCSALVMLTGVLVMRKMINFDF